MKRMSIAEQTLKKQIDAIYEKLRGVRFEISKLREQEVVYTSMVADIEMEQHRLYKQRTAASERVNP
jgi:hypothetical protein